MKNVILIITISLISFSFIFISPALADPFSSIKTGASEVEDGLLGVVNVLVSTWFIIGVFWWLFSKRGFLFLVLIPLAGWAIINGREMLFEFAKNFMG